MILARDHTWPAILVLALTGFAVAGYLALDQLGVVVVWEPFFGQGTQAVLHSSLSQSLPVPDAAVGALAYLGEALCLVSAASSLLLAVPAAVEGQRLWRWYRSAHRWHRRCSRDRNAM